MTIYSLLIGSGNIFFTATPFATLSSTSSTIVVPKNANAIHIQAAVGGGGGGLRGVDYDKAGGESAGSGGGSGAYISDKVFSVTESETLTLTAGTLGAVNNGGYSNSGGSNGGNTTFSIAATSATAFQWQINTGSGFTNINNGGVYSGVNSNILTLTGITSNMSGHQYRCVASNGSLDCSTNSNSATLTVSVLNASPASHTNIACFGGSNGSATVQVSGGSAPYT
jgi:hypothetical protein